MLQKYPIESSEGDKQNHSADDIRRIKMVTSISFITIANMLSYSILYLIINPILFKPAIIFLLILIIPTLVIILINKKGLYKVAKIGLMCINIFSMVSVATWLFGKEPDFQVFLLVASMIPLFLWSLNQKGYLIFFIGLSIILYILLDFFPPIFDSMIELPQDYIVWFRSTNVFICFLGSASAIGAYIVLVNNKEKQLVAQSQQLKKSQQHRDLVYSIIAHDLRSPFNGIVGLTELLLQNYPEFTEEKRKKFIMSIHESSENLNGLLRNLLEWTKMQTGNFDKNFKSINLKNIINEVVHLHYEVTLKKKLELAIEINPDIHVYADSYMVSTIIRNLYNNAIKFTSEGGKITISAKNVDPFIEICIADSGVGISGEYLNTLFDLQSKLHTEGTNKEKGTGLGLKICKDFIEQNGGKIWVESMPGKGSSFCFLLKSSNSI